VARYDVLREMSRLDPVADAERLYRLMSTVEFPWDVTRALELALYRTYCLPSISSLLDATGEFTLRPQKRYDDTVLILAEPAEHGLDSSRGREAISRLNRIHGRFEIANADYLYTLATFVVVPVRWIDRYGWRQTTSAERVASATYYRELGRRMGIRDIPDSYEGFAELLDEVERTRFAYSDANRRVGEATRELFVSWAPGFLAPLMRLAVHAMLDPPVRRAFGFPDPPRALPSLLAAALRARARVVRHLPARRRPVRARDSRLIRSYPDGYRIGALGPPPASPPRPATAPATAPRT
jgi:hypothetical protein